MFLILHQIQNSKKRTDDFGIQINALQEVTVNISEAKLICTGHIFDKNDLKNYIQLPYNLIFPLEWLGLSTPVSRSNHSGGKV